MTSSKKTASQEFIPLREIRDGVGILKNGQMCSLLLASSINFALKSRDEQEAILSQFQSFLNTIDFSLQIYVQSRRLDIRPYLNLLSTLEDDQNNDLMKIQLHEYMDFIQTFTTEVDIMKKSFFVVIPYTPTILNTSGGVGGIIKKNRDKNINSKKFQEDRTQLEQRVSVVQQGLGRIGVRTVALGTDEMVELFYHIFNPNDDGKAPKI